MIQKFLVELDTGKEINPSDLADRISWNGAVDRMLVSKLPVGTVIRRPNEVEWISNTAIADGEIIGMIHHHRDGDLDCGWSASSVYEDEIENELMEEASEEEAKAAVVKEWRENK